MKQNDVDNKVPTAEEEILSVILTSILIKSFEVSMKIFEKFIEEYNDNIKNKKVKERGK